MTNASIYKDISERTGGNIYVGIVGPVRSGKSTFIQKFMEKLVIPNIESDFQRERAIDELPQSSAGRTIMTTEPKFIPEDAVEITIDNSAKMKVRMIDCVGYIIPSSIGYIENEQPRMVVTPWFDDAVPFNMAAEIGTQKVISEHSTVGIVITTDGSVTDIPRQEYEECEERVIEELKSINKPFVVLMNTVNPMDTIVTDMCNDLSEKYNTKVIPINCLDITEEDIKNILANILFEFPVKELKVNIPNWICKLSDDNWLKKELYSAIKSVANKIEHISDLKSISEKLEDNDNVKNAELTDIDLGNGRATLSIKVDDELYYKVLSEITEIKICDENDLMNTIIELSNMKKKYAKYMSAIDEVYATGYGIVMPTMEELSLEEPEIIKQGGKYGVRLKASAPSIHLMKANIQTEVSPIVGSEKQSQELVMYLLNEFEENPTKIWESNIFGKSLHELVNEGLHNKLYHMPSDARQKLTDTVERIINDGCSGLICIIL